MKKKYNNKHINKNEPRFYQKIFNHYDRQIFGDYMEGPGECERIKIPLYQNKYITKIRDEGSDICIQSYYIKNGKLWLGTNCGNLENHEFPEELYIMDVEHVRER